MQAPWFEGLQYRANPYIERRNAGSDRNSRPNKCALRLSVRTTAFHVVKTGSTPVGRTNLLRIANTLHSIHDMGMSTFQTRPISDEPDATAPDGSDVRLLVTSPRGSMAHIELAPGEVSEAMMHNTVEELWFITAGEGEMWRKLGELEEVTQLHPGLSLSIPIGTHFQFRNTNEEDPLEAVAVTMPPWPGDNEAVAVKGKWD